ncbi:MAG: hypothetical protein JNM07_03650 [Phycisphaerae bacterium]|nr:hypothetical protein [Phycisphaerae bacterium]
MPVTAALWAAPVTCVAQHAAEVEAWIRKTAAESESFVPRGPVLVSWKSAGHAVAREEVEGWKREIENHPEHPRRMDIEVHERRARDGPDVATLRLLIEDADRWRVVGDHPYLSEKYLDCGFEGRTLWHLTADVLGLRSSRAGDPGSIAGEELRKMLQNPRIFVSQGLYLIAALNDAKVVLDVTIAGADWTASVAWPDGFTGRAEGSWAAAAGEGRVRLVECAPGANQLPTIWARMIAWTRDEVLARPCASVIELRLGESESTLTYLGSRPISVEEVRAAARPPDPLKGGNTDPVRGELALKRLNDLRDGGTVLSVREGAAWSTKDFGVLGADPVRWLQPIGWVVAASIVTMLIVLRVRARSSV